MSRLFVVLLLTLSGVAYAEVKVLSVEPPSRGADLVVEKVGRGTSKAVVGSRYLALQTGRVVGETVLFGQDADVLQGAIDLLSKPVWEPVERKFFLVKGTYGGSIWIREGVYDLGTKGLVLPLPSFPFVIRGDGVDKTVLIYRGKGEAIGYGEALWKPSHNNVLFLSDLTLRITGNAKFGIRILTTNFTTVERVRIVADKGAKPYCAISNEGAGGQTKLFRKLTIEGPFEVGIFISTDHMVMAQITVKGFRKFGVQGGWNVLHDVTLLAGKGAVAGISPPERRRAGYVRCDMPPWMLTLREFYWHLGERGCWAISDVKDLTPPREGYATVRSPYGWAVVSFKSPPKCKPFEGKVTVIDQELWRRIRPKIPEHIDRPLPEPDMVVYKIGGISFAQVVSRRLSSLLKVPRGAIVSASADDAKVVQFALDLLPQEGRLVLEEATYNFERPVRIPWGKNLTVQGLRCWCFLVGHPKLRKEVRPPREGTVIRAKGEAFVFKDVKPEGLDFFRMAHLQLQTGGTAIRLQRTSAFLEDIRIGRCPSPVVVIEGGRGNVLQMFTGSAFKELEGKRISSVVVDDRGEETFFLAMQHWAGRDACLLLGRRAVVIGGHINSFRDAASVITHRLGLKEWAIVIGNYAEGSTAKCYTADGAVLYLFRAGGGNPGVYELHGGRVVVLGK